jgi:hypothetical protein
MPRTMEALIALLEPENNRSCKLALLYTVRTSLTPWLSILWISLSFRLGVSLKKT